MMVGIRGGIKMSTESAPEKKEPRYERLGFWISVVTPLVLFGLLALGGLYGIVNLVRMVLKLLRLG
jgi:hypothetical protein